MKKLKLLSSLLLVITLAITLIPMTAFASPCCDLWINSVTQDDDGLITVDYSALNPLPNREVRVTVCTDSYTNRVQLYEDLFYISNDSFNGEDTVYTFDGSFLLEGETYVINLSYTYCCPNEYCSSISVEKTITIKSGVPTFEFEDLPDGMLDLIGENKAAVKLTASAQGMYDFSIDSEDSINIKTYPHNRYVNMDTSFYSKDETRIYIITNLDGEDLSARITFKAVTENIVEPETENPGNNDICFKLSNVKGLNKINISKKGIYLFEVEDDEYEYNSFDILKEEGERINTVFVNKSVEEYLGDGTYLIDTRDLSSNYSLTVKYIVPETLLFDKAYTPEYNQHNDNLYYYVMKLTKPSIVTISNTEEIMCCLYKDAYNDYIYGEKKIVLDAGEYYFCLNNSTVENGAEIIFSKEDFESVSLDSSYIPEVMVNNYYYYFAFCAPESGKYEFDFTKYDGRYWFDDDETDSWGMDYFAKEMAEGEWTLVGMHNAAEIKVSKYEAPVAINLNYEETAYYNFVSGKTFLYSFTPEEDGLYKLYTENTYSSNVKVWTDDEVLYETDDNVYYSLNQNYELKKNVPVYVAFSGDGYVYENQSSIVFKSPYIEIIGEADVTVDANADVMTYYVAKESGYHKFNFSRTYGSTTDVIVEIDGKEYNVSNNYYKEVLIYLEKDEKIFVTFKKFADNWLPDVYVSVSLLDVTELTTDTSYTPEIGKYYSFVPEKDGAYKVTFPAAFNIKVSCADKEYISLGEFNEHYFVGKKGEAYLIFVTENIFPSDNDNLSYTDMRITEVDSTPIDLNKSYTFTEDFKIYTFYVPEEGLYRINNNICNTRLDIFYDGQWAMIMNSYSSLFKLEKGFNCIVAQQKGMSYDAPDASLDNIDKPYAKFSINKTIDTNKIGVSIVDAYSSPSGGSSTLLFRLTSPAEVLDLNFGVEYVDNFGETVRRVCGYESMYGSDMRYSEAMVSYLENWTVGDTVVLKPFVYVGDNEEDLIFGEEKTVTFSLRNDITPLNYKTTKVKAKSHDEYSHYNKEYWYSFVQPVTDEVATYITVAETLGDFGLYDETYNYVASYQDIDGNIYFELESGKKYYISVCAMFDDSDAEIYISSLPDMTPNTEVLSNVSASDNSVGFVVSTDKSCKAYVAAYDEKGRFVELNTIENPNGAYTVRFSNKTIDKYKIMILDNNNKPLCNAVEQ